MSGYIIDNILHFELEHILLFLWGYIWQECLCCWPCYWCTQHGHTACQTAETICHQREGCMKCFQRLNTRNTDRKWSPPDKSSGLNWPASTSVHQHPQLFPELGHRTSMLQTIHHCYSPNASTASLLKWFLLSGFNFSGNKVLWENHHFQNLWTLYSSIIITTVSQLMQSHACFKPHFPTWTQRGVFVWKCCLWTRALHLTLLFPPH